MAPRNTHSIVPSENNGRQVYPAFPYGGDVHRPAILSGAIVDEDGEIDGYLPVRVVDNGDGTCTRVIRASSVIL